MSVFIEVTYLYQKYIPSNAMYKHEIIYIVNQYDMTITSYKNIHLSCI